MSNYDDGGENADSIQSLGAAVIPVVNKLQDILATAGESLADIELPQVAVVGSQSSGKSSVLEALVGRDFLPRGNDICTRRPLILQLVRTEAAEEEKEHGEFLHLPGKKFFDFSEIRREIEAETEREAGENKGVSNKQIRLTIYSSNVLDITLVDLPGMTKVPVGDQPSDIEARIRTMILSYIRLSSCLILAVTPANSDLANSDALQIAGIADPDGNRTIGVITKLDIMDRGTDACNYLLGNVIPLRLGYVGVVNRSQQDVKVNRSIKDALASEESFFRNHPVYNSIADRCGIPQLAKKLNQILVRHIYKVLPGLKSRIRSKMNAVLKELSSYGGMEEKERDQEALVLKILSKYSKGFASMVEGRNVDKLTSEVHGGARILYIFQSIFVGRLKVDKGDEIQLLVDKWYTLLMHFTYTHPEVEPFEGLTDDDIRTAIHNATGPSSALFVPEVPFQVLIRRQIARLLHPSLQCARLVYNELVKISDSIPVSELQRFPLLRKRLDKVVGKLLLKGLKPSQAIIEHIIDMEIDYINTSHPNFIGGSNAVEVALGDVRSNRISTPLPRPRDGVDSDAVQSSERNHVSIVGVRSQRNGIINDEGVRSVVDMGVNGAPGRANGSRWVPSIFRGRETHTPAREISRSYGFNEPVSQSEHASSSMIYLREPPTMLRSSEMHSELQSLGLAITKLLLDSYYTIVRKNIEDSVPKAIMHFLVNRTKRELHSTLIKKLYRENLLEELLQENEGVAEKRKCAQETLRALKQAAQMLEQIPIEAEAI